MPKKKITKTKKPSKIIKQEEPEQEVNVSPEMYKAWIEQFANTITETLMTEIVKIKSASKKKKIDV